MTSLIAMFILVEKWKIMLRGERASYGSNKQLFRFSLELPFNLIKLSMVRPTLCGCRSNGKLRAKVIIDTEQLRAERGIRGGSELQHKALVVK